MNKSFSKEATISKIHYIQSTGLFNDNKVPLNFTEIISR